MTPSLLAPWLRNDKPFCSTRSPTTATFSWSAVTHPVAGVSDAEVVQVLSHSKPDLSRMGERLSGLGRAPLRRNIGAVLAELTVRQATLIDALQRV